jgi:thiamine biosynthesis lipoprotein
MLVHDASGGAFDPTVAPATRLWRETRRTGQLPDEADRLDAVSRIGFEQIAIDGTRVRFDRDGLSLDFGGIGKGVACDEAAAVLRSRGIDAFLIDFGGDLLAGDAPTGERGWRVAVRDGVGDERPILLANRAVATSGGLEQFVEIAGERYSHIVDPRTALGLRGRVAATAEAGEAWLADALASAACVADGAGLERLGRAFPGAQIDVSRSE